MAALALIMKRQSAGRLPEEPYVGGLASTSVASASAIATESSPPVAPTRASFAPKRAGWATAFRVSKEAGRNHCPGPGGAKDLLRIRILFVRQARRNCQEPRCHVSLPVRILIVPLNRYPLSSPPDSELAAMQV